MREKKNFMDYIPVCNPRYTWDVDDTQIVTVHVLNEGFYAWIAQKLFHRPKISHIKLDAYGSYVWLQMDGVRSVYDISCLVKVQFGAAAEPVVDRLVQFIRILYSHHMIGYKKSGL